MTVDFKRNDIRVKKTKAALTNSMFTLLRTRNFGKISVNELCEEALVSRATFYAHFMDKYELLQYSLAGVLNEMPESLYCGLKKSAVSLVNEFALTHRKVIKNIIEDANESTIELAQEFIETFIIKITCVHKEARANSDFLILLKFCSGGMFSLIKWHLKEYRTPTRILDDDLFDMLKKILE